MKRFSTLTFLGLALFVAGGVATAQVAPIHVDNFKGHPRVVILSDIGNEPDDQMSFVRLLLYSNELDLEALVATTSTWQKKVTHPETIRALIRAYGEVRQNLLLHAKGWPTAEELNSRVFAGQSGYGMAITFTQVQVSCSNAARFSASARPRRGNLAPIVVPDRRDKNDYDDGNQKQCLSEHDRAPGLFAEGEG